MSELPRAVNPSEWPRPSGYSNAIVAQGRVIALAGQIGWDPVSRKIVSSDFLAQCRQALTNIVTALGAVNAKPHHLIRLTWFITSRDEYVKSVKDLGEAYREIIGVHYPAMSVIVVAGLLEPGAKVEIEATACVP